MRPIWTGSIGFGLVNIPVRLYSAVQNSSLDLDMLDKKDLSNIKFKRVNENTGREVAYKDIVKGYMYNDHYVVLEPDDFLNADAKKTKTIEIVNFVDADEVESIYYEQPYYIEPDKSGARAYALLRDALKTSKKVGLSTFVLRNKESLALIRPYEKALVLNRMRFEEEIRSMDDLNLPPIEKTKPKEQEMAKQLIDQLSDKFDISEFKDTYTEKLLKIIKAKSQGKKLKPVKLKVVHTKNDDLMGMLKASLTKKKKAS
jgi:DNA end-binding protein Ku